MSKRIFRLPLFPDEINAVIDGKRQSFLTEVPGIKAGDTVELLGCPEKAFVVTDTNPVCEHTTITVIISSVREFHYQPDRDFSVQFREVYSLARENGFHNWFIIERWQKYARKGVATTFFLLSWDLDGVQWKG